MSNGVLSSYHHAGGRQMVVDQDNDLLSVAEAARLLRVSPATIKRWLKDGRLPAYHLGPRYIRIRRSELTRVLTPLQREGVTPVKEDSVKEGAAIQTSVRPVTDVEVAHIGEAIRRSQEVIDMIRRRRKGQPLAPSWPILREAREGNTEAV